MKLLRSSSVRVLSTQGSQALRLARLRSPQRMQLLGVAFFEQAQLPSLAELVAEHRSCILRYAPGRVEGGFSEVHI